MKLRAIALAGAVTLALSTPALAVHTGWYLGLGAGYDDLSNVRVTPSISAPFVIQYSGNAIYIANVGYKFEGGWRSELEFGFDAHTARRMGPFGGFATLVPPALSGGTSTATLMLNIARDFKLGDGWGLTLGGGLGVGDVNHYEDAVHRCDCIGGIAAGEAVDGNGLDFSWQAIAGFSYEISDDLDIYADYRYRSVELKHRYFSAILGQPLRVDPQENVGLLGIRWFLGQEPPPPPAPVQAPPPAPPPPVKTFIVFFDFDKSNLTDKAQEVVAEAVRTAKANGFVKVLVTGHTDTVGSDRYNQALSLRRADAVKDEMVREGMDGSGIEIVGKSFHDPLVPTGPGVREPQNRRAVIDLGG